MLNAVFSAAYCYHLKFGGWYSVGFLIHFLSTIFMRFSYLHGSIFFQLLMWFMMTHNVSSLLLCLTVLWRMLSKLDFYYQEISYPTFRHSKAQWKACYSTSILLTILTYSTIASVCSSVPVSAHIFPRPVVCVEETTVRSVDTSSRRMCTRWHLDWIPLY